MVVLSASICTPGGKPLVSRQYVEMTRMRVEGLLAAFPKLVGHAKQHTFVDTDTVRYIYQPLENNLSLVLITTKGSNIVEDLSTLRLLAKVVPDVAGGLQENALNEHAFELIFAFDEVLTAGGYREDTTLTNIRTNLQMESHEENMFNAMQEKKKLEAKATMKEREKEIKSRQMQQMRQNFMNQNGIGGGMGGGSSLPPGGMVGFGGGGQQEQQTSMFDGFDSSLSNNNNNDLGGGFDPSSFERKPQPAAPAAPRVAKKGMKLGMGASKKNNLMAAMANEDNFDLLVDNKKGNDSFGLAPAPSKAVNHAAPVSLTLEEKVSVAMNREGGVESCDIKGFIHLTANTDVGQMTAVSVNKAVILSSCDSNWTFATHPKVDKSSYEKRGILKAKDSKKGFPLGRQTAVLRWSHSSAEAAPMTVTCWPEEDGDGSIIVNMEYELVRSGMVLSDVNIVLPLGTTDPPVVESIDGAYKHDPHSGMLCWHFDEISSSNATGSFEFIIGGSDVDAFFPLKVNFTSENLLCPAEIVSVSNFSDGGDVPYVSSKHVIPEAYQCA